MRRTDIKKKNGLWTGVEIEHTQFKGMVTLFVCRASALSMVNSYIQFPHVYIDMDDSEFWQGTEIGWLAVAGHIRQILKNKRKVTLGVNSHMTEQMVVETSELRRTNAASFCLLLSLKVMCPDMHGYAVKIVPYHTFDNEEWMESGVLVRTAEEFEKGKTVWSEYIGDKDLP